MNGWMENSNLSDNNNNNFFPSFTFNHICNMAATCEKKTRKERDPFKDFAN